MSWAADALSKAASAASSDLAPGPIRDAALEGILALEPAVPALDRRGKAALRGAAAHLIGGDVSGAALVFAAAPDRMGEVLAALGDANAADLEAYDAEQLAAADWLAVWGAVKSAGLTAAKIALPFVLAAAGL